MKSKRLPLLSAKREVKNKIKLFYVKHFELPLCMKCAIQINLPCLALPCLVNTLLSHDATGEDSPVAGETFTFHF